MAIDRQLESTWRKLMIAATWYVIMRETVWGVKRDHKLFLAQSRSKAGATGIPKDDDHDDGREGRMLNKGKQRQQDSPDDSERHEVYAGPEQEEERALALTFTPAAHPEGGSHRTGVELHTWSSATTNASHSKLFAPPSPSPTTTTTTTTPAMTSTTNTPESEENTTSGSNSGARSIPDQRPVLHGHRLGPIPSDDDDDVLAADEWRPLPSPSLVSDVLTASRPSAPPLPSARPSFDDTSTPSSSSLRPTHIPLPPLPISSHPLSNFHSTMPISPSLPIPDSAHINPTSSLTSDTFLPLLNCPLCDPPSLLVSPITLRCGHTICLKHLTDPPESPEESSSFVSSLLSSVASSSKHKLPLPSCPLPTCKATSYATGNATAEQLPRHPQSRVNYLPPPPVPLLSHLDDEPDQEPLPLRVDVTVNKILNLVVLSRPWFLDDSSTLRTRPFPEDDVHTDSESEDGDGGVGDEDAPDLERHADPDRPPLASVPDSSFPNRASRRPRTDSPSPSRRPRKRPRRTHDQSRRLDIPNDEPPLTASAKLEKELYTELTCHICFGLMWQPVTTPCQHVRSILFYNFLAIFF